MLDDTISLDSLFRSVAVTEDHFSASIQYMYLQIHHLIILISNFQLLLLLSVLYIISFGCEEIC